MAAPYPYFRPAKLQEAIALRAQHQLTPVVGGTDFYPARADKAMDVAILDLSACRELQSIELVDKQEFGASHGKEIRVGAGVTWSQVLKEKLFESPAFEALRLCAKEVGGVQIQNRGTLVGNICNASPAADGVPTLMALGAEIELASQAGTRRLPLSDFLVGPRRTSLVATELAVALYLPQPGKLGFSSFLKLGSRRYLVISIAMLAGQWSFVAGQRRGSFEIEQCKVAVGACSPVAIRLPALETWCLQGMPSHLYRRMIEQCLQQLAPIDDVRADRRYRLDAVETLCNRLIQAIESSQNALLQSGRTTR